MNKKNDSQTENKDTMIHSIHNNETILSDQQNNVKVKEAVDSDGNLSTIISKGPMYSNNQVQYSKKNNLLTIDISKKNKKEKSINSSTIYENDDNGEDIQSYIYLY